MYEKELLHYIPKVILMSEKRYKRFYVSESENQLTIYDNEGLDDYYHLGNDERDVKGICDFMNEQQSTIRKLQDLCGKSDRENAKLRIENKKLQAENEQLSKEHQEMLEKYVLLRLKIGEILNNE